MWLYPFQRDPLSLSGCIWLAARSATPPRGTHTSHAPGNILLRKWYNLMNPLTHSLIWPWRKRWFSLIRAQQIPGTWWCPGGGSGCPRSWCSPSSCCTDGRRRAGRRPACRSATGDRAQYFTNKFDNFSFGRNQNCKFIQLISIHNHSNVCKILILPGWCPGCPLRLRT